jgi:hypothetical protein
MMDSAKKIAHLSSSQVEMVGDVLKDWRFGN